jgi:hypothetical protein
LLATLKFACMCGPQEEWERAKGIYPSPYVCIVAHKKGP